MPIMNGVEATIEILKSLEINNLAHSIPILACSAFESSNDIQKCLSAGMLEFLKKPINFIKIKEVVKKYLK